MTTIGEVFLVDDEAEIRQACRQTFELEGYAIRTFKSADEVLTEISPDWLGVVISDVRMPGMDGLELLRRIKELAPELPVIILTGHGDVPMALEAIRLGAYDFLEKPAPPEYLIDVARRALDARRLCLENRNLKQQLETSFDLESRILGNSPGIKQLRQTVASLATIDVDVLLLGETGVGKELTARSMHECGARRAGAFVALNCGAIPANLVESELFGHERGAFTSAMNRRIGKIEQAQGGTLFLDEVESMPLDIQVKLLRALQERVVERVGSNKSIAVDYRVIAASKIGLREAVRSGAFREDLFYRLNVARVAIPPLRERTEDIMLLLRHFMGIMSERFHRAIPEISPETMSKLQQYYWPGNVRELRNVAQQLVLGLPLDLSAAHLSDDGDDSPRLFDKAAPLDDLMEQYEKQVIEEALARNEGKIEKTAQYLGIPRKRLYLRMQKYGLQK
ncbi:sigma-54 dependent transcriptional regulator [Desulfovibrio subterraneus]|jgi:two-component system C4-dicarboxylate transport response regulator DctD|uniref:C4-dicarboxylate transport transcriptional regulatory protein DctD n=1 Tax=Desulfovibrio subterraneus TaxID=2718620 RepID=A0A7J0BJH0_9BACT|nr:sigma-54 dependent transcriptional regulator [Desulfovibrio subterraneus]WBF67424.1 sigma-54 dependent transcriptional regulator [Desulfovibrio subterraneus]GFM33234.1 C4-dicarboxylate transport transcriptional regulatory protein DctD [Desulfovibrio subterraneus]